MRDNKIKVRENRLRRMADRQGLKLQRSPRRDTRALDYGLYALTTYGGAAGTVHPQGPISIFTLDLDEVEQYLVEDGRCHICGTELSHKGYCGVCNPKRL